MAELRMTNDEIRNYLSVNQNARKRVMLQNIDEILMVNSLLTDVDISVLRNDTRLFDALHNIHEPFYDVLDTFFMNHLDVTDNSNDVMLWLHDIYA